VEEGRHLAEGEEKLGIRSEELGIKTRGAMEEAKRTITESS